MIKKLPKAVLEGWVCSKCGSKETYKNPKGNPVWFMDINKDGNWTGGHICYNCYHCIGMPRIKKDMTRRKCSICESNKTYESKEGYAIWIRYLDNEGKWDRKSFVCAKCYHAARYRNLERNYIADWRIGNLDPNSPPGKGYIGVQIVAKTLGIEDLNIMMNNFLWYVDLSKHPEYGIGEVKIASLNAKNGNWKFAKMSNLCDTLFFVCMDENWPWENVERVYVIPCIEVFGKQGITIYKDLGARGSKWEIFRVDPELYNTTYHMLKMEDNGILRKIKK